MRDIDQQLLTMFSLDNNIQFTLRTCREKMSKIIYYADHDGCKMNEVWYSLISKQQSELLRIDGVVINGVDEFYCLGSIIWKDGGASMI